MTEASIEQYVEMYRDMVQPDDTSKCGVTMLKVAEMICEREPKLLARLTDRDQFYPGRAGIPNDVRCVIGKLHALAYPDAPPYRNYGKSAVRRAFKSPRTRIFKGARSAGRYGYARGWAVCGFGCAPCAR